MRWVSYRYDSFWRYHRRGPTVVSTVGILPAHTEVLKRRLQNDLLITGFPKLARLPLDRNSLDTRPVAPSMSYRIRNKIVRMSSIRKLSIRNRELRFFYRVCDINSEGWRLVRDECDRAVQALSDVVDLNV